MEGLINFQIQCNHQIQCNQDDILKFIQQILTSNNPQTTPTSKNNASTQTSPEILGRAQRLVVDNELSGSEGGSVSRGATNHAMA